MKLNRWTYVLAAAGVVSLGSVAQAEESLKPVMSAVSNTTLSGYVDTSAIWQLGHQRQFNFLPGRSYDGVNKQDGFNLNVVKIALEKPLDEGNWSAGYKAELLFGPDANAYGVNSSGVNTSDFGIKQAYVALRAPVGNGLDFKMGVFDTVVGYEVFDSGNNPNYSRSYGFFIEPTTHTGALASYTVTDWLSIAGGVANTVDPRINGRATGFPWNRAESEKSYLGSIALTAPESFGFLQGATLYGGVVDGQPTGGNYSDIVNWYVGGTIPTPVEGLSVGAAYDYRGVSGKEPRFSSTYDNAVSGYLVYKMTEKLTLANRAEYATGSSNGALAGSFGPGLRQGGVELFGETFTVDYKLWEPVITRVEFRWDTDLRGNRPFGQDDKNALSLALNVIYKF